MPISLESTGSSTASSAASAVPSRESSPDPSALQLASTSGSSTTSSSPAHPLYASTDEPSALIPARLTGLDLQRLKDQQQQFVAAAVQESQPVPSLSLMDANRTGDSAETDVSSNISRGETTGLATFRPSSPPPPSLSATKTTFLTATTITAAPTVATQLEPNSGQECNGGGSSAAPVLRPRTRSASTLSLQQFPPSTTSVPVLELDPGHQDLKKRAISPMLSEADRSGEDSCPPCLSTPFPSGNTRSRSRSRTSSSAVLATEITSSKTSLTDITQTASGRDDRAPSSTLPFTPSARALSLASIDMTWDDPTQKPPFSYASLIARAILESRELKLTLGDIYAWITSRYPWYKHSPPAWQNSIRHNLSLNKAFRKLERTVGEPGKGCFWSLEPAGDVQPKESSSSSAMGYVARKRTSKRDAGSLGRVSSQSDVGAQQQEDSDIDDDDDVNDDSHRHHKDSPGPQNILSPAASDEADNEKIMLATSTQPRRSGRARKPPKPRDMDDFILASSTSALSLHRTNSSSALTLPSSSTLSTPPCSPGGPLEGKKSTATVLTCASSFDSTGRGASAATAGDASGGDSDLIMTSRRVRRPPPKLSEFVSSEDFKASVVGITARSGRRTDRAASGQSSTRTSLSPAPSTPLPSLTTSAPDNRSPVPTDHPTLSVNSKESKKDRRPKIEILIPSRQKANFTPSLTRAAGHLTPCLGAELPIIGSEAPSFGTAVTPLGSSGSSAAIPLRRIGPPSVSLSALSHKKRPSLDQTLYGGMCNDAKKSRRLSMQERRRSSTTTAIMDSNSGRMMEDDDGAAVATACKRRRERKEEHQRLLQRIRREALKHEDDDWSGSDFEFLREEEEKYLRRICAGTRRGARPQQYRWRNDDVSDDEVDGEEDEEEDWDADSLVEFGEGRRIGKQSRFGAGEAEAERKAKALLLDPSVIAYGFDSGDQDYILDYHQSPLFNSVSWPEFSDVKTGLNVSSTNASTGGVPTVVAVAPAAAAAAAATATTEALNHMDTTGNSTQASHTTVSATSQASLMHQPILVPPVTSTLSISPPSVPLTPPSSLLPLKEEQQ